MNDSTGTPGADGEATATAAQHRDDATPTNHDDSGSGWRRKLLLTAFGAVVGGAIRAIVDWALTEIHP